MQTAMPQCLALERNRLGAVEVVPGNVFKPGNMSNQEQAGV